MKFKIVQQNIPSGWRETNLGSVADLYQPQTISKEQMSLEGRYLVFGANGIIGKYDKFNHEDSEVVVTCRGASCGSVSMTPKQAWITGNAMVVKVNEVEIIKPYTYYFLKNSELNSVISGGAQPQITRQPISAYKILYPKSKKEQQKIAEILGTVDEDIAKTQEVIEATEKLKRGLMQQLFTRGIGHTKFKETESGEIPAGWEVKELKDVSTKIGDGLHGTPEYSEDSEFYFINGNNISEKVIKIYPETKKISVEEHQLHKKDLTERSILLSINGTIGNIGFYMGEKVVLGKSVAYINCDNKVNKEFIAYQLETERIYKHFTKELTGTTIKNLSLGTIRQTPVFVAEVAEQKKIAEILSAVDEKISINKKLKEKLTLLKKGLMQDLLSGNVRVN